MHWRRVVAKVNRNCPAFRPRAIASSVAETQHKRELLRGRKRQVITYSTVLSALEKGGEWRKLLEILDLMETNGVEPNGVCVCSAILALDSAQQTSGKVEELFHPVSARLARVAGWVLCARLSPGAEHSYGVAVICSPRFLCSSSRGRLRTLVLMARAAHTPVLRLLENVSPRGS